MAISDILEKINPQGQSLPADSELYLALVVGEKTVKSGIWSFSEGEGKVLSFGSLENWEGQSAEELIVVADASIAAAVSKLPEVTGQQPTKTILGLPESWVEGNLIKKEKLNILEETCKKLLLKPLGFVVTPESIAHWLKKEEGGSPSAILVGLENSELNISLLCEGKFLGGKTVGRSDNLALDLEEGLLRFDYQDDLPSRILLLDGENLEEAKQALVSYPWIGPEKERKLNFLQLPRVEIASLETEVSAVVMAGSRDLSNSMGKKEEKKETDEGTKNEEENEATEEEGAVTETVSKSVSPAVFPKENFGFVEGRDIAGEKPKTEEPEPVIEEEVFSPTPSRRFSSFGIKKIFDRLNFKGITKNIFKLFSSFHLVIPRKKSWLLFGAIGVLLASGLLAIVGLVKAEVKLLVQPQKIEKEFDFTASAKVSSPDLEKMILPFNEVSVEVSGQKTATVTGKKTVGDKATGEVTVYNRTDQVKVFSKETKLKGPANLNFILLDEVRIASKTADLENGVDKWGEAKVKVGAAEIGTQYNLAANSAFSLEGVSTSSFLVKNIAAFSGGTSREIQAVSKEDQGNLQKALMEELEKQAQTDLGGKIDPKDLVLPNLVRLDNKIDSFNREEGDEASDITLEEKAIFAFPYLKNEDFLSMAFSLIRPQLPEGFNGEPFKEEKSLEVKDEKKSVYTAKTSFEFLPEVKTDEILSNLPYKTFSKAESYLKSFAQIAGVEILVRPSLFSWVKIFPSRGNIKITVEPI